jgi:hypothetical protein
LPIEYPRNVSTTNHWRKRERPSNVSPPFSTR